MEIKVRGTIGISHSLFKELQKEKIKALEAKQHFETQIIDMNAQL